ncbi:hypothetical protein ES332_A01G162200v1 [Gossypium tomentosum]|uniref:Uncharacterized protein n=1 Tax=Gossypium tomentosum TaxID=34277 RepID=A0A5D2RRE7_GOSTO|nr:hypothetical protein ES332_A01G162200v1 [Gossypium tomentosum]
MGDQGRSTLPRALLFLSPFVSKDRCRQWLILVGLVLLQASALVWYLPVDDQGRTTLSPPSLFLFLFVSKVSLA